MQSYLLGQAFRKETPPAVILANGVIHGLRVLSREVFFGSILLFVKTFPGGGRIICL